MQKRCKCYSVYKGKLSCAEVYLEGGGAGRALPPRNLTDQLTLFKPEGQIMPLTLLPNPPDSKSYLHLCSVDAMA